MGWRFKWLSSFGNDFNFDYQSSFRPDALARGRAFYNFKIQNLGISDREGVSVFYKAKGAVFYTYSAYPRGIDILNTAYHYLISCPRGATKPATTSRSFGSGGTMNTAWRRAALVLAGITAAGGLEIFCVL